MVHRPADSRLLSNLLAHEKDYAKHLAILLDYSQASLASFSAYAAASAPPTSQVIIAVAGALAGADDALRSYAAAVERWQEQLRALKTMEEDVGNIMRDREILVTRLIKASKQQKPTRDSIIGASSASGSSLSVSKPEVQVGHKLSIAQAELQACEAHLAAKEQELNAFRIHTIRAGLHARCTVMVECGWKWGEMGKEGMRALETLDAPVANGLGSPVIHPYLHKPLPGFENASSDVSSIAPSQSASQIGCAPTPGTLADPTWAGPSPSAVPTPPKPYTLQIPPAHSIGEFVVPNGTAHPEPIFEEPGGSSAEEDDEAGLEVHENPRFNKGKARAKTAPPAPHTTSAAPSRHISFSVRAPKASAAPPNAAPIPSSYSMRESPTKKRGVFGGLAALFHVGSSRRDAGSSPNGSPSKRWQTRIDRNLAASRRGDSSDDDGPTPSHQYASATVLLNTPPKNRGSAADEDAVRLRKKSKRGSVQAQPTARLAADTEKGYASDTVTESMSRAARAKGGRRRSVSKPSSVDHSGGSVRVGETSGRLKKPPAVAAVLFEEGGSNLSRNSSLSKQSITSAASAPPRTTAFVTQASLGRQASLPRKRIASLEPTTLPKQTPGHRRTASVSVSPSPPPPNGRLVLTNGEPPSLMSIVEGISKMNKQSAVKQDPNRLLIVPKAPPPLNLNSIRDSWGEVPVIIRTTQDDLATPARRERPQKGGEGEQNNYRNSLLLSGSVSAPSLPLSGVPTANTSKPLPTPVKMPLRSALRNPSRTPSPAPAPLPSAVRPSLNGMHSAEGSSNTIKPLPKPAPVLSPITIPAPVVARQLTAEPPPMKRRESDISSISSYETGNEMFDDAPETPRSPSPDPDPAPATATAPTPSVSVATITAPAAASSHEGSEVSNSTSTASTVLSGPAAADASGERPKRRKSVRMSLPPTFSATPPALDDTDEDDGRLAPWAARVRGGSGSANAGAGVNGNAKPHARHGSIPPSASSPGGTGGWGSRIEESGARDMWVDSSDEEEHEEYSAARKMLTKLSRKHERGA